MFVETQNGSGLSLDEAAILLEEFQEAGRSRSGLPRCLDNAGQKEIEPGLPVAVDVDLLKKPVILLAMALEIEGRVRTGSSCMNFSRAPKQPNTSSAGGGMNRALPGREPPIQFWLRLNPPGCWRLTRP